MDNNDLNAFYQALGQALSEWQFVEWELFWTYNYFLRPIHWEIASASYYSHHTFRGKIRLLKSTAKMYFLANVDERNHQATRNMHKYIKSLNEVLKQCGDLADKRNDLAHHMIDYDGEDENLKPVLVPPFTARNLQHVIAKTNEDIESISLEFTDLADLISDFNQALFRNRPNEAPQRQ